MPETPLSTRTSTLDNVSVLLQSRYSKMYILFCFAKSRYDEDECVNIVNRIGFYCRRSWGCLVLSSLSQKHIIICIVVEFTITMGPGYWMGFIKQTCTLSVKIIFHLDAIGLKLKEDGSSLILLISLDHIFPPWPAQYCGEWLKVTMLCLAISK